MELNGSNRINDLRMDLGRIDQTVTAATTEMWEVTNRSGTPHNFHVHGVQFNVASYLGSPPPPHLAGWKDTVFIPPDGSVRLLVQFPGYSDPVLPYMFHCHLLQHEDNGMMGQFLVVQPTQPPTSPSQQHHHDPRQNPTSRELQYGRLEEEQSYGAGRGAHPGRAVPRPGPGPDQRGPTAARLPGGAVAARGRVEEPVVNTVLAHAHEQYRTDLMSRAVMHADAVAGLLVAAALVRPEQSAGMKVSSSGRS